MAAAAPAPDVIRAVQSYINKILRPKDPSKAVPGLRALLLDAQTKTAVSMAYSMHEVLSKDVYLVEDVAAAAGMANLGHLAAIVLVRPTPENVRVLLGHLREPRFREYHIFFTNIVPQDVLRKLADGDALGVVKQVQEFYVDYFPVNADLFSLNMGGSLSLSRPRGQYSTHEAASFTRTAQGLLAALLALKLKPYVRYQASSVAAQALARELTGTMSGERDLFTFQRGAAAPPLLLVLDRREDPLTPLLSQWTYQAMVHELLKSGIKNNTVDLKGVKGISKDLEQVVLSVTQDEFFRAHKDDNYGDLDAAVRSMLAEYSALKDRTAGVGSRGAASIEDMHRFMDAYPEFKAKGLVVSKHVALTSEISAQIEARQLMTVSEAEQNMAASDAPNDHFKAVADIVRLPGLDPLDALRLLMIYALRYERTRPERVAELRRLVCDAVDVRDSVALVDALLAYGGAAVRGGELFSASASMLSKLSSTVKRGVAGVENVFTQHEPLLVSLLDQLARGKLSKQTYPYVGPEPPAARFSTVIVFVVGGTTYEEASKVAAVNAGALALGGGGAGDRGSAGAGSAPSTPGGGPPFRVILGGNSVLNSKQFMAELKRMHDGGVAVDVGGGGAGTGM